MLSVNFWTRCLVFACLLAIGCGPNTGSMTADSSEEGGTANPSGGADGKKKIVPVKRDVKDLVGNWVIVVTSNRTDNYRWITKFSRGADGKIAAEFVDTRQDKDEGGDTVVTSSNIEGDSVNFTVKTAHGNFVFAGLFQDGFIRGTVKTGHADPLLARLLPTDATSLDKYVATGKPPGSNDFEELFKLKDLKPEMVMRALQEFRTSPVTQDIYQMLISAHVQMKFDEAKVNELISGFESSAKIWGPNWESRVEMAIAVNLIKGRQFAKLAIAHLDAAEKLLGDDLATFQPSINAYRDGAKTIIRIQEITDESTTKEVKEACYTDLTQLLQRQAFNAEILNALAIYAQQTGKTDEAIGFLTQIVAYPLLEGLILKSRAGLPPETPIPSDILKKLWQEKHGSEEGLAAHLEETYHKLLSQLSEEVQKQIPPVAEEKLGNKCVLVELFTGMQCPPCVAADLGLVGLSRTYSNKHVAIIQYHQHIPQPDGLVNQDSEDRAGYYESSSTPTIIIDGIPIDPRFYSGYIQNAGPAYSVMRRIVDPRIEEKTDVALNIKAEVTEGVLNASVEVTGVPDDQLQACRLRMAIVENNVKAFIPLASNGLREQEYVVREMIGGANGIPAKKGELKYSASIPLADVNQRVVDYITRFEAGRRIEFPAGLKPAIQGPLSLVVWVQNGNPDKETHGKLVLQAAIVPIGDQSTPETAKTNVETPESSTKASSDPAPDVKSPAEEGASSPAEPPK